MSLGGEKNSIQSGDDKLFFLAKTGETFNFHLGWLIQIHNRYNHSKGAIKDHSQTNTRHDKHFTRQTQEKNI